MDSLYCTFNREILKDGVKHLDRRELAFYPKYHVHFSKMPDYDPISPKEAAEKLRKFADTIEALEE